jgi:hypothetical protein
MSFTATETKPTMPEVVVAPATRLIVEALSEDAIAAPENRMPNYITLSVTNEHGLPVTGLTVANFKLDAMIVAPGGVLVEISRVSPGRLPGFYFIDVVPIRAETWKAGAYIFGISVENGSEHGQTLCSVVLH